MNTKIQFIIDRSFLNALLQRIQPIVLAAVLCIPAATAKAVLPVTGYPVPELAAFDTLTQEFMDANSIQAGVVAISKDKRVVYQHGFGYAYNGVDPLPENTPMRLASVSKPFAAAAIRYLIADGVISLDDFVFDVGQTLDPGQRALLDARDPSSTYWPYNGTFGNKAWLEIITVEDCIRHHFGYDRDVFDPMYREVEIGLETGHIPPGRLWTVKYAISQPFQFEPGTDYSYCNFGYMLLSLIVEQETGWQHTMYLRLRVLTPEMWVPITELFSGRTLAGDCHPREPRYAGPSGCKNVFNPTGPLVWCPYGSFYLEQKLGEGNLVASAAPLLTLLDHYRVDTADVGMPITSAVNGGKDGAFYGTSTMIQQYSDGFSIVILFAKGGDFHADHLMPQVRQLIDNSPGINWDSLKEIDGFWVDFNAASSGYGGHDDPFHSMTSALNATGNGTKLRFKPGTSSWTGTISTRMMFNTPSGSAIIGQ